MLHSICSKKSVFKDDFAKFGSKWSLAISSVVFLSLGSPLISKEKPALLPMENQVTTQQEQSNSKKIESNQKPCETISLRSPDVSGYNAPVISNPCAYTGLYVEGSFLYWKATSDYLNYALVDTPLFIDTELLDPESAVFTGVTKGPSFDFNPGYKVGIGYKFHRDGWDLYAEYTRFHQMTKSSVNVNPDVSNIHALWLNSVNDRILAAVTEFPPDFVAARSKWTSHLDILDFEIGRNMFVGRRLIARPSLGLRTLWLDQIYDVTYRTRLLREFDASFTLSSFNKSCSWGIGPRFCLNNMWELCGGLKILGDVGASLLYMHEHVASKQINPIMLTSQFDAVSDISYANKAKIRIIKPILDMSLGLGWGHAFFRRKCSIDLSLNYDFSMYWNQAAIQLGEAALGVLFGDNGLFEYAQGRIGKTEGNLSIQGLRATARFDF